MLHLEDKVYPIVVDYAQALGEAIDAYEQATSKAGTPARVHLVRFDHPVKSRKVRNELERSGFHPASLEELLSLGATFPGLQDEFPILALGTPWWIDDHRARYVPCLSTREVNSQELNLSPFQRLIKDVPGLYLAPWSSEWDDRWRFAAIREAA